VARPVGPEGAQQRIRDLESKIDELMRAMEMLRNEVRKTQVPAMVGASY
jgi:hypothetical protein